jgi:N-acyl-D-aspartate/D-glutamate deacylase
MELHTIGRLTATALAVTALTLSACGGDDDTPPEAATPVAVDLLIQGGTIYNGDSDTPVTGDVGIVGERIVFVGKAPAGVVARRTVDAAGKVVAPGFIDPHTHANLLSADAATRLNAAFTTQGVTTAIIGSDGYGGYDIAAQAALMRTAPPGTNAVIFAGFGPVRQSQLGLTNAAPTPAQLDAMRQHVADAMCEGAVGLSAGLYYTPQTYAATEEVIEMAKVAATYGGLYDTHMRDESTNLKAAVAEVIRIGNEAKLPVHISHIKALGADVMGQAGDIVKMIEDEQAKGLKITANQYPWLASSTYFDAALVPSWALAGGRAAMLQRFDDPAQQAQLRAGIAENLRIRNGAASILFAAGSAQYVGKTLADVATTLGVDAVDATIAVLRVANQLVANFNQTNADVQAFMKRPWVMTSSDSSPGHPRAVGSFAQKYAEYVVKQKTISLAQFIRSSTSLTADTLGMVERGRLKAGHYADVVVFDPVTYAAAATYTAPTLLSKGVVMTVVNGQVAVENGAATGVAAGRALLRAKPANCPATTATAGTVRPAAFREDAHDDEGHDH